MEPWILGGEAAHSPFRLAALLNRVRAALENESVAGMETRYCYLLDLHRRPDATAQAGIVALLNAAADVSLVAGFTVAPRRGSVSPWSSKATDIFRNCGLRDVARVERGVHYCIRLADGRVLDAARAAPALPDLYDRMTEDLYSGVPDLFSHVPPPPMIEVDVLSGGRSALERANREMGLALSDEEIAYLFQAYERMRRNPTDVELVMFGQVNSEHCRHKIFNADWEVDGRAGERSLFDMIRHTHECRPQNTLVAYHDNSSVMEGFQDEFFRAARDGSGLYAYEPDRLDILMKVETHNHPTAISPFPGAATGVGGEIRDEAATGIGGKSKAGLSAFIVSHLRVPGFPMPWEPDTRDFPARLATPFQIMIEGPIGGAGFGNEFGRPQLLGLFRTFEARSQGRHWGYHKPIMVAGGLGCVRRGHIHKRDIPPRALIVQMGGPALRIGLGGGAASSMATGSNAEDLDFNSVQRGNAEMERRCQETIDACIALGDRNPILSIHDIGAGGLSNGCPELVSAVGARFSLRKIHSEDRSMSPMEIWCCEAQERYVLAVRPEDAELFARLAERERCPMAIIGEATGDGRLTLHDEHFENTPIDMDLATLLGKPPKMLRKARRTDERPAPWNGTGVTVRAAVDRVLRMPAVADKTFLITIADRSVTGLVARDQMVGPWQTPIADAAVTMTSHRSFTGEAMSLGERVALALIDAPASGRMAIGEAVTNLAAADVDEIGQIRLSANWMCACGEDGEDARLYDTVRAVAMELCPALGLSIPVGKDSLSMRTLWQSEDDEPRKTLSPLSLIVSAFAPVRDVRRTATPDLKAGDTILWLVDLGGGRDRLGGSALAQAFGQMGDVCPDLDEPARLVGFFAALVEMRRRNWLLAYHDRSDGGLLATLAEMAFGGRRGLRVRLPQTARDPLSALFAEELGAVLQVSRQNREAVVDLFARHGLADGLHELGATRDDGVFEVEDVYTERVSVLHRNWSELTYRMQAHRDHPECAREEYDRLLDEADPGMNFQVRFENRAAAPSNAPRPQVAILREQGINGQVEMAAAFDCAGLAAVDVHMTDLIDGRARLADFAGLVACGGFSYGDVLGAGSGWAKSILYNERLKEMFAAFFARPETFALGVCNGCQMLAQLKELIPGAEAWPLFARNRSEQFEARFVTVEVMDSPSVLLRGMAGSRLGVPVAHGEGRTDFGVTGSAEQIARLGLGALRYVDHGGAPTERYPLNPNGSAGGLTGLTTGDGRVTVMMPHPERVFRGVQMSWRPPTDPAFADDAGPWLKMFRNAAAFAKASQ
jgi:phosphoribosylformylglycinamidine synthase